MVRVKYIAVNDLIKCSGAEEIFVNKPFEMSCVFERGGPVTARFFVSERYGGGQASLRAKGPRDRWQRWRQEPVALLLV
ncbi:hypothetical protein NBRC116594_10400 [Shimia sp. NS0008-38b]